MKYILYIEDHNGQSQLEFNSLKMAKDELATRISFEKSSGSSVSKNSDDDYSIRNYWRGNTHMYIKKATQPTKNMTTVRIIRNLNSFGGSVLKFQVKNFAQWLSKKKQEWKLKGYQIRTSSNEYNKAGYSAIRAVAYKDGVKCFAVMV